MFLVVLQKMCKTILIHLHPFKNHTREITYLESNIEEDIGIKTPRRIKKYLNLLILRKLLQSAMLMKNITIQVF